MRVKAGRQLGGVRNSRIESKKRRKTMSIGLNEQNKGKERRGKMRVEKIRKGERYDRYRCTIEKGTEENSSM